jgi:prolyl-tRNA synthetase
MTCEAMMGDGKALQLATSHELGQNFARAFDITYTDADGSLQTCWTTSWGSSTRMMGGLIMCHGDQNGLRIPPRIAPIQAVVLAVKDDERTLSAASMIESELKDAGVRVRLDARSTPGFGRRAIEWELKGVPLRIEIGPRDLDARQATLAERDTRTKTTVPLNGLSLVVREQLDSMQSRLLEQARSRLTENTTEVDTVPDAIAAAATGFARIPYATLGETGEDELAAHAITVRCLQTADGDLPSRAENEELFAIVGRSY